MRTIAILCLLALGCAPRAYQPPVYPKLDKVEEQPLPPHPAEEKVPSGFEQGDWLVPVIKGECVDESGKPVLYVAKPCPAKSGILSSEERAWRDGQFRIRYKELRTNYEADRKVVRVQREFYETQIKTDQKVIQSLQPTWWSTHKFSVGVVGGMVLGILAVVGASHL